MSIWLGTSDAGGLPVKPMTTRIEMDEIVRDIQQSGYDLVTNSGERIGKFSTGSFLMLSYTPQETDHMMPNYFRSFNSDHTMLEERKIHLDTFSNFFLKTMRRLEKARRIERGDPYDPYYSAGMIKYVIRESVEEYLSNDPAEVTRAQAVINGLRWEELSKMIYNDGSYFTGSENFINTRFSVYWCPDGSTEELVVSYCPQPGRKDTSRLSVASNCEIVAEYMMIKEAQLKHKGNPSLSESSASLALSERNSMARRAIRIVVERNLNSAREVQIYVPNKPRGGP